MVNDGQCEDSLNIVSSEGELNNVAIKNSYADAVDIDFSVITIDKLSIDKAGNDCFDVSGVYLQNSRGNLN